ncbi:hypothetical protein BS47DRAFT_1364138 [Hydnum rufescens UP504]|uniref:Helicase ATP-binding domain-containing protein n=1 Tax=Hydnum rufescens UP504 TaxID=1448309 RepID=A0A9P6DQG5_9AGAM|nr:hypothetical protein BS47DRAFT_1364138 [Hydnum rufescens UP504]
MDLIFIAATGSGKTLIIAMWMLLHPDKCIVTISPLKELQRGQASGNILHLGCMEFLTCFLKVKDLEAFGLKSIAINKDMTRNTAFWNPAALLKPEGPFSILLNDPVFRECIGLFVVDEVHNIDCWGCSHMGNPLFQPEWNQLGTALSELFASPRILALTATAPPSVVPHIVSGLNLHLDTHIIFLPSGWEYQEYIWEDFALGKVLLLVATSSAGTGCNAKITCNTYQTMSIWKMTTLMVIGVEGWFSLITMALLKHKWWLQDGSAVMD